MPPANLEFRGLCRGEISDLKAVFSNRGVSEVLLIINATCLNLYILDFMP